jgi:hypothetical protein
VSYTEPSQGVAQVVEQPWDHQGVIVLYGGPSGEATRDECGKSEWCQELGGSFLIDLDASYVTHDSRQRLASGDWDALDSDLVWAFGESLADEES